MMRTTHVSFILLAIMLSSRAAPSGESGRGETCDLSNPQVGCRLDLEALSKLHKTRDVEARKFRFDWGDLSNIFDIVGTGADLWKDHKDSEAAQSQPVASQTQVSPSQQSSQPQRRSSESKTCDIAALTPGCELDLNSLSQLHSARNLDERFHIPDLGGLSDIIDIGKTGIHLFDDYIGKDKGEDAAQDARIQQSQPSNRRRSVGYCDLNNPIPGCVLKLPSMRRGVDFHNFHPGHWVWDETKKAAHFIDNNLGMDSHDESGSSLDARGFKFKDFIDSAWDKIKDGANYVDDNWGLDKGEDEAQNAGLYQYNGVDPARR